MLFKTACALVNLFGKPSSPAQTFDSPSFSGGGMFASTGFNVSSGSVFGGGGFIRFFFSAVAIIVCQLLMYLR